MNMNCDILVFFVTIILVFDVMGFSAWLISLLFSTSPKKLLTTFVGAILMEAFLLYLFWGFPPGCTAKTLFKTPIATAYGFLYQVNSSSDTPGPVKLVSKPGAFLLKQFLSDQEERFAEKYVSKHPVEFIVNQVSYYVISCCKKEVK